MTYRPEPKGSMAQYLRERDQEERTREQEPILRRDLHHRSVVWLEKYHARGHKTAFNWSPSITVTKTEETTSEAEVHHQEADHTQASEVGIAEGVGDAPSEGGCQPVQGLQQEEPPAIGIGSTRRNREHINGVHAGDVRGGNCDRFVIEGHTDFGDGDTPF
jgi:hypothetical protein